MTIEKLWSVMKHNMAILRIRINVSHDMLKEDYENVFEYIHDEGEKSVQESIKFLSEHEDLNDKISECLERYYNEFQAINSDPMDIAKASNLIDFVKNFPKYINFDLKEQL